MAFEAERLSAGMGELAMLYGQALIEDATHEERRKIDAAVHRLFYPEVTEDEMSVASVEVEAP